MASASGFDSQLGISDEVTYGTYVAPTRFFEYVDESVKMDIERIASKGLRAGRRVAHRWAPGVKRVQGDFSLELPATGSGILFNHAMGGAVTSGAGPYTHTFDGTNDLDGTSFSLQIGRPDNTGVVQPFSYSGCKVTDWSLDASVNEFLSFKVSVYAAAETTAQPLAVASYPTGVDPFVFTDGSLTVGGTEVCVQDVSLSGSNNLATDRHRICTNGATPKEPLQSGMLEIDGSFKADFSSLTLYNSYVNGADSVLVLTFASGTDSFTVTMNTRFDGETPTVGGAELLEQPIGFTVIGTPDGTDADAFSVVLVNGDSAP